MYLLLSGEGATDIGVCNAALSYCDADMFSAGPMALVVDKLVEKTLGYDFSHIDTERVTYVSESYLAEHKSKPLKKSMTLPGKKRSTETKYYYENARALAIKAKSLSDEKEDHVVAVLFRDSDGTASAGRGDWDKKRESMLRGFEAENFHFGIPMIPKPKSEAWLLCATKDNPYQHCSLLENESGNDRVENSLKSQLSDSLKGDVSLANLIALVQTDMINISRISMPSFDAFVEKLSEIVTLVK
jgi:hypothetical protein